MSVVNITILLTFLLFASKFAFAGFWFPAICFASLGFIFFVMFWIPNDDVS